MASDPKKLKLENGNSDTQEELANFKGFQMSRILRENAETKSIVVEGVFPGSRRAVVVLERAPITPTMAEHILTERVVLKKELVNDIYGQYECSFPEGANVNLHALKANVVLPATQKHVQKYSDSPRYIVEETPELYHFVTLPFLKTEKFTIDWVYNILDHKKESERIVFEDPDPETGFILLPDFKWNGKQVEDMYLVGIIHSKNIRSVRDLRKSHLPLLKKLLDVGCAAISEKYSVPKSQLRVYFHYQPSYYHLHVHYNHIRYNAPGITSDRAHLLSTVISNIEMDGNYYAKAVLPFLVSESSNMYKAFQSAGYDFGLHQDSATPKLPLEFLRHLGNAKHEPCGEHWNVSYGDSAWRMALMSLCLRSPEDKMTCVKLSLASALTSFGKSTDQNSEWCSKVLEVRNCLQNQLSLSSASSLYHGFLQHVSCRRKACMQSPCHKVYRQVMELEESLLLLEELQVEGGGGSLDAIQLRNAVLKKISEMPFDGNDSKNISENVAALLNFLLQISSLTRLRRTGWVRSKVRDPERVSGHMFRMGVIALLIESGENRITNENDVSNSAMVICLIHDLAECIVGDITPSDPVTPEEKHKLEVDAMEKIVRHLSPRLSKQFTDAFKRYEAAHPEDKLASLAKDLDKFDMVFQAFEYEDKEKRFGDLEDFFKSTSNPDLFKHPIIQAWDRELRKLRCDKLNSLK